MKIEIDTKHDSPDEIKKVIKVLEHLVGEHAYSNQPKNIFEDQSSFGSTPTSQAPQETQNAFVNMFGSASETNEPKEEPMDKQEEPAEEENKAEPAPEVIPY